MRLWFAAGLALAACSGSKPVLLVDVTGDQTYPDVSLRLTTGPSLDKTFSHVTFGSSQVFRAGLFLNGVKGAVTLLGEADNGQCVLARGAVAVPDVAKVTGSVALTLTALAGCEPPQGRDGGGDAATDGDAQTGSGGAVATGGRDGGTGGGGLGGMVAGSGGMTGAGGMSGVAGHGGTGGAGTGGTGAGGSGTGGSGAGGSGTGGAGGASTTCTGWGASADVCEMESQGFVRTCNCPGSQGCLYYRFADSGCSTCSPYSCSGFSVNGTTYGPIGTDPRPVSCRCANCTGDLSNVGTGNFNIQFTITTTTTNGAVLNQRSVCYTDVMWDIRTTADGGLQVETDDDNGTYTAVLTPVVVADGNPHSIVITRLNGTLLIMVDGTEVASGSSTASLGALHALSTKTDICDTTGGANGLGDGTVPLVGTVTDVCVL